MGNADSFSETGGDGAEPSAKESEGEKTRKRDTSAKGILKLIERMQVQLFHTPEREAFASFYVRDHWENCRVKSSAFKSWLSELCYHQEDFVPGQSTLAEAINTVAGRALYASPEKQVYLRLAESDGAIYVDLGSNSWQVVRITSEGWDIVSHAPVKFARAPDMHALPLPRHGGRIDDLRQLLNLGDDDNWKLALGWQIGTFKPTGPFPLLVIEGTHGSAKSAMAKTLLSLVDPHAGQLRAAPRDGRDLVISAENSWCLGFDNLSSVQPWFSDALCRLATGGGFSTRALYTDDEEKVFKGTRPVLLNGIDIGIHREDLRDRCIFLSLPPIKGKARLTDAHVYAQFFAIQPFVLGCLFDAVACALRRLPDIKLPELPRMADFTIWVSAAEPALGWPEGSFFEAYLRNRREANSLVLEVSALFEPIMRIADHGSWEGTATELLDAVCQESPANGNPGPFPRNPKELSQMLRRLAPNLVQAGYSIEFARTAGSDSKRIIRIKSLVDDATQGVPGEAAKE